MFKKKLRYTILILFFALILLGFYAKANLVQYRYHLDPRVNKPLGELIEGNYDREANVMFKGLGLRLYYYYITIYKLTTGISYEQITKYGFIIISTIQTIVIIVYLKTQGILNKNKSTLFIGLLLFLSNSFIIRRLSITVRENIAIIGLLSYLYVITKYGFKKRYALILLSGIIYGSNPITSFILLAFNFLYTGVSILMYLIKRKITNLRINFQEIQYFFIQFLGGIILGLYFFIMFIKSLFRQYNYVEKEVVEKNPYPYSYYYISKKHLSSVFIPFILLGLALYFINLYRKKSSGKSSYIEYFQGILLFVYIISFFPQVGLYQDRIIFYIGILGIPLFIPVINRISKVSTIILTLYLFIILIYNFTYKYTSPYDNTNLSLKEYNSIQNFSGDILAFNFDEHLIYYINFRSKVNKDLTEEFMNIADKKALREFNKKHTYAILITRSSMRKDTKIESLYPIRMIYSSIIRLEDGNYIYFNQ